MLRRVNQLRGLRRLTLLVIFKTLRNHRWALQTFMIPEPTTPTPPNMNHKVSLIDSLMVLGIIATRGCITMFHRSQMTLSRRNHVRFHLGILRFKSMSKPKIRVNLNERRIGFKSQWLKSSPQIVD